MSDDVADKTAKALLFPPFASKLWFRVSVRVLSSVFSIYEDTMTNPPSFSDDSYFDILLHTVVIKLTKGL